MIETCSQSVKCVTYMTDLKSLHRCDCCLALCALALTNDLTVRQDKIKRKNCMQKLIIPEVHVVGTPPHIPFTAYQQQRGKAY
jgi:hypothetical protein